ncbi:hypothetical protein NFI96_004179 [Prochilodus magdalenae]|nr:hypothetical protein NFI96_004179 [Prochilodus magdalenae]
MCFPEGEPLTLVQHVLGRRSLIPDLSRSPACPRLQRTEVDTGGAKDLWMACCQCLGVGEDTGRFVLLALAILLYLLGGAGVFSALEAPLELQVRERWAVRLRSFSRSFNISQQELSSFLRSYEEAKLVGIRVDSSRARWDFSGAFYFVGTVVSTIEWDLHLRVVFSASCSEAVRLNEGLSEGLNEGLSEGLNEGLSEGLNEGLSEGLHRENTRNSN